MTPNSSNLDFRTTHWSVIVSSRGSDNALRQASLTELYQQYWYPLFAYLRRKGHDVDQVSDYVQGFFAELIEKDFLKAVAPEKCRFRWFLMSAIGRYVSKQLAGQRAQKRGGGATQFSLNAESAEQRYQLEISSQQGAENWTPERLFDRRWALELLNLSLEQLRQDYEKRGKLHLYLALQHTLSGDSHGSDGTPTYAQIAQTFQISESTIKVTVLRMRERYREVLCRNVAQTVCDPESVGQELDELLSALRG